MLDAFKKANYKVSAEELAGVFYKYAKDKPFITEEEIEKATEEGFIESFKNEEY
jgi:hypothetical protein